MSKTTTRSIHCDNCARWSYGDDPGDTFTQIRAQLKRRGWKVKLPGIPGGKDLCPFCPN